MKRYFLTCIVLILLAACAPDSGEQPATLPAAAGATQPAQSEAASTEAPASLEPPASPTAFAVAESPTEVAPDGEVEATAAATATAEAPPEPAATVETVAVNGRTEDGAYFLGRADAPVTIVDYSDFL